MKASDDKITFLSINKLDLMRNLLKFGFLPDARHISPLFSSESFGEKVFDHYIKKKIKLPNIGKRKLITFRSEKRNHRTRMLSIPHPGLYLNLCIKIGDDWTDIKKVFLRTTKEKPTSAFIPKYFDINKRFFSMVPPKNILEIRLRKMHQKEFVTKTDISKFYYSIYTHSISWAILGKEKAKKEYQKRKAASNKYKRANEIDCALREAQDQETMGLPVGPDTSALIAELILSNIDTSLIQKGYKFIHFIDDYNCFTKDNKDAEAFFEDFRDLLREYNLKVNEFKTSTYPLPLRIDSEWLPMIRDYPLPHTTSSSKFTEKIISFLDFSVLNSNKFDDLSCIKYALNMILGYKNISSHKIFLIEDYFCHLCSIFPFLTPSISRIYEKVENLHINVDMARKKKRKENLSFILKKSISLKQSDAICFIISAAISYDIDIESSILKKVLETNDCMSILSAFFYEYEYRKSDKKTIKHFKDYAEKLPNDGEFWMLKYELYYRNLLTKNNVKDPFFDYMKNSNITFLKAPTKQALKMPAFTRGSYF